MTITSAQRIAIAAAQAASDKKAEDIQILKMPAVMVDTDYFVICSASTYVQIRAIVSAVIAELEEMNISLLRHEGRGNNNWVLLDYGDVVVHVFLEEDRRYYDLEKLWADAERVPFE